MSIQILSQTLHLHKTARATLTCITPKLVHCSSRTQKQGRIDDAPRSVTARQVTYSRSGQVHGHKRDLVIVYCYIAVSPHRVNCHVERRQRVVYLRSYHLLGIHCCSAMAINSVPVNGLKSQKVMDVGIVGGSLGGLMAGIALKALGHNVTILERNPTQLLHNQGAGIVAGGDMLAFFKKYDRCQRPIAVTSQKRMYFNQDGKVVHEVKMQQNMTSWCVHGKSRYTRLLTLHRDLAYYLLRANYDRVESEYCKLPTPVETDGKAEYLYGHRVTAIEQEGPEQIRVQYETSDDRSGSRTFDLVIGADGPSSTVRSLFIPNVERKAVGYCALRGTVPEIDISPIAVEAFSERFAVRLVTFVGVLMLT